MAKRGRPVTYPSKVGVNVTAQVRAALDDLAAQNHRMLSDELRIAIARYLRDRGVHLSGNDPQMSLLERDTPPAATAGAA